MIIIVCSCIYHTRLGNFNLPVSLSGRASTFVQAKDECYAVFSPQRAVVQLLNSYKKARKQLNK